MHEISKSYPKLVDVISLGTIAASCHNFQGPSVLRDLTLKWLGASSPWAVRFLTTRSGAISKPRDWTITLSYRSLIGQASRQYSCRGTYDISLLRENFQNSCEVVIRRRILLPWWRHQIKTFSALLAFCAGNSSITGEFPTQRPVTRGFDVFFDLRLNKKLSKHSWGWWFEMPSRSLWRHCNA